MRLDTQLTKSEVRAFDRARVGKPQSDSHLLQQIHACCHPLTVAFLQTVIPVGELVRCIGRSSRCGHASIMRPELYAVKLILRSPQAPVLAFRRSQHLSGDGKVTWRT